MAPDAPASSASPLTRAGLLHLLTLWSFAVAQPLYEVLRRNGEFFVAHQTGPLDVLLFVLAISLVAPLVPAALCVAADLAWRRAGRLVFLLIAGVAVAAVALQALDRIAPIAAEWALAIAAVAGGAAAWMYASKAAARLFLTVLSPAVLIFPAVMMLHPDMAPFVRPSPSVQGPPPQLGPEPPPIVMIVFDQLPLTSLMTEAGEIDAENFPGFARLAASSTWYRNATAVGDNTGFALPPILTGMSPDPRRLPVAQDHPRNLFTWLAGAYRFEVIETITGLCPSDLCPRQRPPVGMRLASMLADSAVVWLHIVLPEPYRAKLPSLTENWKNFANQQNWARRWVAERDADRRRPVQAFLESISRDDEQPTLYFLHALLPHEPYVYLRDGRRFTPNPQVIGLRRGYLWTEDEAVVIEQYRLHLIQLGYVDRVIGALIDRLHSERLWERALVVVTADHGASFRPGLPFKIARLKTIGDIAPVPLFVKAPGQQAGAVSDRNIEAVDVLPTIAELLGTKLSWTSDGSPARSGVERPFKSFRQGSRRRPLRIPVDEMASMRTASAARKVRLFGAGPNPYWRPTTAPHRALVGKAVSSLTVRDSGPLQVLVEDPARYRDVDPGGPVVPSQIAGRVVNDTGLTIASPLAVAVNGTIVATTNAYEASARSNAPTWTTFLPPDAFVRGRNRIEVFVLGGSEERPILTRGFASGARPDTVNLASRAAARYWGIEHSGLHHWGGTPPLSSTEKQAAIVVPLDTEPKPRSLRVGLASGPAQGPLRIEMNGCVLFEGRVDSEPWYRTFPLRECGPAVMEAPSARIVFESATRRLQSRDGSRDVGVLIETVNLYAWDWPLGEQTGRAELAIRPLVDSDEPLRRGTGVSVAVANTGSIAAFSPADSPNRGVELDLRWAPAGGTPRSSGQRVRLARTLYPGERLEMQVPLSPPSSLEHRGPWDLYVVPVHAGGMAVPLQRPCVLRVLPD